MQIQDSCSYIFLLECATARHNTQPMTVGPRHGATEAPKVAILQACFVLRVRADIVCAIRIDGCDSRKWLNFPAISFETVEQRFYGKPCRTKFFEESMEFASCLSQF